MRHCFLFDHILPLPSKSIANHSWLKITLELPSQSPEKGCSNLFFLLFLISCVLIWKKNSAGWRSQQETIAEKTGCNQGCLILLVTASSSFSLSWWLPASLILNEGLDIYWVSLTIFSFQQCSKQTTVYTNRHICTTICIINLLFCMSEWADMHTHATNNAYTDSF